MIPEVRLEHQVKGRIRLRISSRRGDSGYFQRLESSLSGLEGIEQLQSNPLTGSLLILHRSTPDEILAFGEREQLFTRERTAQPRPVSEQIFDKVDRLDDRIVRLSQGRFDLRGATVFGLATVGIVQVMKAHVWPAGFTLLWYAVNMMNRERNSNGRSRAAP